MKTEKQPFLKKKKTLVGFALFSFLFGFLFLKNSLTGNVVINNQTKLIEVVPILGILLIACSGILTAYVLWHKE